MTEIQEFFQTRPGATAERGISLEVAGAAVAPLLILPLVAIWITHHGPPWLLMWLLSCALWLAVKWGTLVDAWRVGLRPGFRRSVAYMFAWPNTDALTFLDGREGTLKPTAPEWVRASLTTCFGLALLYVGVRLTHSVSALGAGWVGMIGLVLVLHFGLFQLLALAWRQAGINATSLMQSPIKSTSLAEFWGRRWNTGFSGPARRYLYRPLVERIGGPGAGLSVFVVSGLLHEAVISLPAGGGYGLPTAYFLFQAVMLQLERSRIGRRIGLGRGLRGWIFVLVITAGPALLVFHPAFIREVILPFLGAMGAVERSIL
jgi:hypothetical protein